MKKAKSLLTSLFFAVTLAVMLCVFSFAADIPAASESVPETEAVVHYLDSDNETVLYTESVPAGTTKLEYVPDIENVRLEGNSWYESAFSIWDYNGAPLEGGKEYYIKPIMKTAIVDILGIKMNISTYNKFVRNIYIPYDLSLFNEFEIDRFAITDVTAGNVSVDLGKQVTIGGVKYIVISDTVSVGSDVEKTYEISFSVNGMPVKASYSFDTGVYFELVMQSDTVSQTGKELIMDTVRFLNETAKNIKGPDGEYTVPAGHSRYNELLAQYPEFVTDTASAIFLEKIISDGARVNTDQLRDFISMSSIKLDGELPTFAFKLKDTSLGSLGYSYTDIYGETVEGGFVKSSTWDVIGELIPMYALTYDFTVSYTDTDGAAVCGVYNLGGYIMSLREADASGALSAEDAKWLEALYAMYAASAKSNEYKMAQELPDEGTEPYKMPSVLLIGQSNMVGCGDLDYVTKIDDDRIHMWRDGWTKMVEPMFDYTSNAGAGLGASFAKGYVDTFNTEIGLIPAARGGTRVSEWQKGQIYYEAALEMALEAQKTSEIVAILWHQGEGDTATPGYAELCKSMFDSFIMDLGLDRDKVVIITGELGRTKRWEYHRSELDKLFGYYPNYSIATTEGLVTMLPEDVTHFDGASQRVFGYRYFREYLKLTTREIFEFDENLDSYRTTPEETDPEDPEDTNKYIYKEDFNSLDLAKNYYGVVGKLNFKPTGDLASITAMAKDIAGLDRFINVAFCEGGVGNFFEVLNEIEAGTNFTVEADFAISEGSLPTGTLFKFIDSANTVISLLFIDVDSNGNVLVYNAFNNQKADIDTSTPAIEPVAILHRYDFNEWSNIKVVCNMTENTKDIYVDGKLMAGGLKIADIDTATFATVKNRVFQYYSSSKTAELMIDNYKLYLTSSDDGDGDTNEYLNKVDFNDLEVGKNYYGITGDMNFKPTGDLASITAMAKDLAGLDRFINIAFWEGGVGNFFEVLTSIEAGTNFTVEADFAISEGSLPTGTLFKFIDSANTVISMLFIDVDSNGNVLVYNAFNNKKADIDTSTPAIEPVAILHRYDFNEWANIKVVCNMTENTKDIYVDGELMASGLKIADVDTASFAPIKDRVFQYNSSSKTAELMIDNYKLYLTAQDE